MARVRFPGRPGHRFDQIRVAYFNDDIKNYQDPSLAFLPQFRQGLRTFHELVGASDEDDEFEGFTPEEIQESENRLEKVKKENEEKEKKKEEELMAAVYQLPGTRMLRTKSQPETRPAVLGTHTKLKAVVKKSHDDMLEQGFKSPDNSHCVVSMTPLTSFPKVKSKKLNFGKKARNKVEIPSFVAKPKKTEMDMAKFLLEKAKQANLLQQQAKARRLANAAANKVVQRKEFVLPSQSSRSSRVIIPNKRFLEDDSITSPIVKKKKSLENNSSEQSTSANNTPTKMDGTVGSPAKLEFLGDKPLGSLEKPLILDGKRDRKPSVKVLEKIVDKSDRDTMGFRTITSPIAAPKLGKNLFPSLSGPPATFQKASESQKFMFGSTRKQGASIVQKAKLHLNRAALNKSKAALARSLKAEMKKEAKMAEIETHWQGDVQSGAADVQTESAKKPPSSRKRPICTVCGIKGKQISTGFKTGVAWCYKKFYCCQACLGFYAKSRYRAKTKKRYKCDGNDPGHCKLTDRTKRLCQLCRILRIIEVGFPQVEVLRSLTGDQPVQRKAEVTPVKGERRSLDADPVVRLYNVDVPKTASGRKLTSRSEKQTPVKDESDGSEFTPPKDNLEQKRRRRSSKEPIKSPFDKGKIVEKSPEPEPSTSLIVPVEGSVEEASPQSVSHGPRIKHVCRNAAVVLGKTPATFPEKSEFRLSALPNKEKVEIWKQEEEVKAATNVESDDDRPLDEIIEKSTDAGTIIVRKAHPELKEKKLKKLVGPGGIKMYKRKRRCKQCSGCLSTECGKCRFCLDMPRFGGRGAIKQACARRKCKNPIIQQSATAVFIKAKGTQMGSDTESNTDSVHSSPGKQTRIARQIERPRELMAESEIEMTKTLSTSVPISIDESECKTVDQNVGSEPEPSTSLGLGSANGSNVSNIKVSLPVPHKTTSQPVTRSETTVTRNETRTEVRRLEFDTASEHRLENLATKRVGKMRSKVKEKVEIQQKYTKNPGNNNQCFPVTLVNPTSRQWGSAMSQPRYHPIKVDYKGKCDVNNAWIYGIAVTMSSAMSVRTLCFLCASSGKHELVFCNVCCEPFHKFCLEEFEQPVKGHDADWCCARCQFCSVCGRQNNVKGHDADWCCARCQFCSVCGRQNNLLQCDKCQNMYHPECLGPNYPTKPTKEKKIWICTKCVKCKSCGATTPGVTSDATWTYDFSLCYECGKLMDKGNFCPICRKCYSDDDWESKMIQCNTCESWVHSNCEGLTDEMYEILSYLPEDLSFYCQRCSPAGCPEWMRVLRQELRLGLENIMQTLIMSKCAQYIIKQESMMPPPKQLCNKKEKLEKHQLSITDVDNNCTERPPSNEKSLTDSSNLTENKLGPSNIHKEETDSCETSASSLTCDKKEEINSKLLSGETTHKTENQSTLGTEECRGSVASNCESVQTTSSANISEQQLGHKSEVDNSNVNSIQHGNGSLQTVQNETRTGENGSYMTKAPGLKVCDTISGVIETDKNETEETKGCAKPAIVSESIVSDSNVLTKTSDHLTENNKCTETKKEESDCNGPTNDVENNELNSGGVGAKVPKTDVSEHDKAVVIDEIKKCDSISNETSKGTEPVLRALLAPSASSETSKGKELVLKTPPPALSAPTKHHVQFNIAGTRFVEAADAGTQALEPAYPRDLMEIAEKMKTGFYKSVALFCEDILRIIQEYLDNDEEIRVTRKKATQSAKMVFVKQMEKIFPWFQIKKSRYWYSSKYIPDGMLPDATLPPTTDHTYAQWLHRTELPKSPQPSPFKRTQTPVKKYVPYDEEEGEFRTFLEGEDTRRCMFCLQFGDQDPNDAGRLLYCGQDDWAHINCALWSAEVYEDENGALINLVEAYSRGKMLKCDLCGLAGATVGCNTKGCKSNYHFMCARDDHCRFQNDKKVFCKQHIFRVDGQVMTRDRFGVYRRVYVDCLNVRNVKKHWSRGLNSSDINVLIGSCCVEDLGRLTDLSDKPRFLQPVDFVSTRIYWSTKDARRRCVYSCRIFEVRPHVANSPTVEIKDTRIVHDEQHPEFIPFSKLDLDSLNLSHLKPNQSTSDSFDVDLTQDESACLSLTQETTCSLEDLSQCRTLENTTQDVALVRSTSFSGTSSVKESSKKDSLSKSWSGLELRKIQKPVKLKGLSPQTLRLLNIKDPLKQTFNASESTATASEGEHEKNEDLSLLKIADRLNSAAAKSSRHPGVHSREGSPSPLTVPRVRPPLRNRSRSLDSVPSIHYKPTIPSVGEEGPAHAWTPPTRLSSRANSWPNDRQTYVSILNKSESKPENVKLCELMDINPLSDPIGASSPKVSTRTSVNIDPEISQTEKMEMSLESTHDGGDGEGDVHVQMEVDGAQKVIELQVEGNDEPIPETTFVVMTDTSEEISEEDAIKIVQEALSGNSDILDSEPTQPDDGNMDCEDIEAGVEPGIENSDKTDLNTADNGTTENQDKDEETKDNPNTDSVTSELESICTENRSESPFIPQFVPSAVSKAPINRKELMDKDLLNKEETQVNDIACSKATKDPINKNELMDKELVNKDDTQVNDIACSKVSAVVTISDEDSDSDVLDITDSVYRRLSEGHQGHIASDSCNGDVPRRLSEDQQGKITDSVFSKLAAGQQVDIAGFERNGDVQNNDKVNQNENIPNVKESENSQDTVQTELREESNEVKVIVPESDKEVGNEGVGENDAANEDKVDDADVCENDTANKDKVDTEDVHDICDNDTTNKDEVDGDQTTDATNKMDTSTHRLDGPLEKNNDDVIAEPRNSSLIKAGVTKFCNNTNDNQIDDDKKCDEINTNESEDSNDMEVSNEVPNSEDIEDSDKHAEEMDPKKKQVLRGLGLGTNDEVEEFKKNSPTKASTCFVSIDRSRHRKPKYPPSFIKKYPLRRKTLSLSPTKHSPTKLSPTKHSEGSSRSPKESCKLSDKEIKKEAIDHYDDFVEKKSELPVLDPIAKKIKEESLAKSCPEEKGPFKCQTCRRQYRTETSYEIHVKNCTFYVSSSDDEDSESSKGGLNDDSGNERQQKLKPRDTRNRNKDKQNSDSEAKTDDSEKVESFTRSSLRKSTMFQRVAIEVEERRLKEEALQSKHVKKKSQKPGKSKLNESDQEDKMKPDDDDDDDDDNAEVTRRVTRRSGGGDCLQMLTDKTAGNKKSIGDSKKAKFGKGSKVDGTISSSSSQNSPRFSPVGRRGTRRQRHVSTDSDSEAVAHKVMKLDNNGGTPDNKRRTRSSGVMEIADTQSPKSERRRGRPPKVKKEDPVDVVMISSDDDDDDDGANQDTAGKQEGKDKYVPIADDIDNALNASTKSDDSNDGHPILDYASGLIVDAKTGEVYSPMKKDKSNDSSVKKKDVEASETCDIGANGHLDIGDENANCLQSTNTDNDKSDCVEETEVECESNLKTSDKKSESLDKSGDRSNSDRPTESSDKGSCVVGDVNKGDSKNSSNKEVVNSDDSKSSLNKESEKGSHDHEKLGTGKLVNLENSQDMTKAELSKTVLELLKKGHKVLIKNPASDRSYVWEKTATGYVGKPLDKEIHKPVSKPVDSKLDSPDCNAKLNDKDKLTAVKCDKGMMSPDSVKGTQKTLTSPDCNKEGQNTPVLSNGVKDNLEAFVPPKTAGNTTQKSRKELTVSEILASKKEIKRKGEKLMEHPYIKGTPNLLKRLVKDNVTPEAIVSSQLFKPQAPAGTEYLGGIILSSNKDISNTDNLRSTAEVANAALQNSLQIQNDMGPSVQEVYRSSGQGRSLVQFIKPSHMQQLQQQLQHPLQALQQQVQQLQQPMIRHAGPVIYQNMLPSITSQQSSVRQPLAVISPPSVRQPLAVISPPSIRQPLAVITPSYNTSQIHSISPTVNQQPSVRQPVAQIHSISPTVNQQPSVRQPLAIISSSYKPSQTYSINPSVNQQVSINQQVSVVSPVIQSATSIPSAVNVNNSSLTGAMLKPNNFKVISPTQTNSNYQASSQLVRIVSQKNSTVGASLQCIEEHKKARLEGFRKKMEGLIKQPPIKPIIKASLKSKLKSPMKDHTLYIKRQTQKRYKRKQVLKPRSPLKKVRKPSAIAAPHSSGKASHPIIHPQKETHQLPIAAVEEEIQDIPLSTMMELENAKGGHDKTGQSLGHLEFEITSDDGFSCRADTLDGAWKQVIEKVQDAREANRVKQLSYTGLSGIEMFGLSHPNVVYLLEQLSGAGYCRKYKFKYHKHEPTEQEVELLNPSGCIRSEPFTGRNPWDMFSFLMSRYRQLPERSYQEGNEEMAQKSSRRATSMDLPMAMRFRKLKAFSRECVGVYRSYIHGRGLFCKRKIDAGEMIIEYAGEVIRNSMTDSRELYYESKGIGCYMFRIDDENVVDATMKGSAARFINHSCEPNCYSKVITVDNRKHIVIFALRQIYRGEELTYDYKFPIEEVKIPCTCGALKCRKYLN